MRKLHYVLIVATMVGPVLAFAADVPTAKIQPGQWRSTETVLEFTSTMLDPEMVARRKAKPTVFESCIKSDDLKSRLIGKDKLGLCQGDVTVAGGKIAGSRNCTTGFGKGTRKLVGSYTATRYEYVLESDQATPQGPNHIKSRFVVERTGECKAGL
jgi:Protein of unknown function (DUF3617)